MIRINQILELNIRTFILIVRFIITVDVAVLGEGAHQINKCDAYIGSVPNKAIIESSY